MVSDLPLRDPEVYRLARELDRLRRQIHDVEVASQGAHRSVEDGAIDVYDDNDVLRERIGRQADGTYGRKSFAGDPPPAPTDPDVQVISDGVVAVTWDGRFEEKYLTGEFRAVQVHLGDDPTFVCSRNTMEGALFTRWGGTVVVVTESDDDNPVYVKLRAINRAGVVGAESAAVLVDEDDDLDLEDDEEFEFSQDKHQVTTAGDQRITLSHEPEQDSEDLYINGISYDETDGWSRDGQEITLQAALVRIGDQVRVEYAHRSGTPPLLAWKSSGYQILLVDRADTADYSGVTVDTSAWTVAAGDFGGGPTEPAASAATWWPRESDLWVRHEFPAATEATVKVLVEDNCSIWINGQLIASTPENDSTWNGMQDPRTFVVPAGVLNTASPNVIAVRASDEPSDPGTQAADDNTYLDLFIEGR